MEQRTKSDLAAIIFFLLLICPGVFAADLINPSSNPPNSASPADTYSIRLFTPEKGSIHSAQIKDIIHGHNLDDVIFATSYGLATYNGSWNVRHSYRENISAGLMDDYITAIEYDNDGNLWLGYSGGIQVYNGVYYKVFRDQELLKDPRITDLQRWNDDMWVATGNSGLHRARAGNWTWFKPSDTGKIWFNEADSLAIDSARNYLIIATRYEGLWEIRSPDDPVQFEMIEGKEGTFGKMEHVRRDPLGGVYFFNSSTIIHYSRDNGFTGVITADDLSVRSITINDIAADSQGRLFIGTDDGIFIWDNNQVYRHLGGFEGIGSSPSIKTIHIDAQNRVWFSTSGDIGYYFDNTDSGTKIPIDIVTPTTLIPIQTIDYLHSISDQTSAGSADIPQSSPQNGEFSLETVFTGILDPVGKVISDLISGFNLKIFP